MDKELAGFGWYIKRIDNALAREACRNVQSHNLTMQQSHLLFVLSDAENHTRTLKELESIFGCAQSTLAGLVTRLEKKGLVEGFTDPRDRRIKHVRLTESGAEMRQTCHKDILQSEKRMSAGMAPMPAVLINSLSAAPRGTTLVSPVTMAIPAARAVSAMLATTASRVAISSPSSRIKPQER